MTRASAAAALPPAEPPEQLEAALAALHAARAAGEPLEPWIMRCAAANSTARNRFMIYREAGEAMLAVGRFDLAELFAIRSLRALPRYGAAFRLLGHALEGTGRQEDAARCHRYQLPDSIRERHFGDTPLIRVASGDAVDTGVQVLDAFPHERVALSMPAQLVDEPLREFAAKAIESAAAHTVVVPNGRLWFDTFNTVVWDRDGRAIEDVCRGFAEVVQGSLAGLEPLRVEGRVCLLGNRNAHNYYHWMNDVLPRLAVLRESGFALDSIDRFLLGPIDKPFQRQSLARFGIGEERLLETTRIEYVTADEVLLPVYGSNSLGLRQGRWNAAFLKRSFLTDSVPDDASRRLYVSRGSTGPRGIVNEAALLTLLEQFGFRQLSAEALDVAGQARAFAAADVVLGPHGAGLSNTAFCRPGTLVIELFDKHIEPCFWAISALADLHHAVHRCGPGNNDLGDGDYHSSHDDRRDAELRVDIDSLGQLLERQLTGR